MGVTSVSGFDGLADHGGRPGTRSERRGTYEGAVTTLALSPRRETRSSGTGDTGAECTRCRSAGACGVAGACCGFLLRGLNGTTDSMDGQAPDIDCGAGR